MEAVRATLDWLGGKQLFSTFDLKDGFFQVKLSEKSRPLTAVRTVVGLLQYTRLPQRLKKQSRYIPTRTQRGIRGHEGVLGDGLHG